MFVGIFEGFADAQNKTLVAEMKEKMLHMDMNSMIGSSMPLGMMPHRNNHPQHRDESKTRREASPSCRNKRQDP